MVLDINNNNQLMDIDNLLLVINNRVLDINNSAVYQKKNPAFGGPDDLKDPLVDLEELLVDWEVEDLE